MVDPWENDPIAEPWNSDPIATPAQGMAGTMGGDDPAAGREVKSAINETVFPAINDFIASVAGLPVDAVNTVLRMAGVGSDKPVGGSESLKGLMGAAGINATPDVSTPGRQMAADVTKGVASGLPFGPVGIATGAASGVGANVGRTVGKAIGGEPGTPGSERGGRIGEFVGGVGAGLAPSAAKAVGRMAAPRFPEEVAMLEKGGVKLTSGRVAGGEFQRAEEGAKSLPIAGGSVRQNLEASDDSFVLATINRALEPIGEKVLPGVKAGHEAVDDMVRATDDAYNQLLPQLKVIRDPGFDPGVASALERAIPGQGKVARQSRETVTDIINNQVIEKFDELGTMSGKNWKEADTILGQQARDYLRSTNPPDQAIGRALKEVQIEWRNMLNRTNPELAPELGNIARSYAMQLVIERAAKAAPGGKFNPAQLEVASKGDVTTRTAARGNAPLQDWATAARRVMSPTVPDSGTPLRTALRDFVYQPAAGVANVAGSLGFTHGMNAALRGATNLSRIRTAPAVPFGLGASMMGSQ